ncbi:methyltransferase family protein [Paraperlucidibaca baekdonensis]|uniref:Methyltransferase family protein n=1 Tax=Paraperlucidibaca baekdonensis TaxID=748120 RepID=A0A3E0H9V8_9GAMM|nr:class I SAM-dependent methyltransferase [Paraperlucidibaca baekdonensis]REH40457.1 methyltransferase family protein [Paraperlucidibaca baekdonensis]
MDTQSRLLGAQGPGPYWGNLGDWRASFDTPQLDVTQAYAEAARRLAYQHARAIDLAAPDQLLELGAGQGASLALWAELGIDSVITMDRQRARHAGSRHIACAFDAPWPALPLVDAVIAVDALYHARDFAAVLQRIGQHLMPSGRWAMTTLEINPALSGTEKRALALQLRACRIAWAGVWHGSTDIFHAAGLQISGVEDLSEAVLSGFAEAIGHRAKAVRWIDTCHPAWVKLSLTARLCRHLVNSGKVRYVLISGNAARR